MVTFEGNHRDTCPGIAGQLTPTPLERAVGFVDTPTPKAEIKIWEAVTATEILIKFFYKSSFIYRIRWNAWVRKHSL